VDVKSKMRTAMAYAVFVALVGCASPVAQVPTANLDVTADRFIVDGNELTSTAELRSYLVAHAVRDVRVTPRKNASFSRITDAMGVLQELGIGVGIVGNSRP
jgi:hypothetical protein